VKPDLILLIVTILVALIFDFLNGFHDAANSIADRGLSTRVLSRAGRIMGGVLQFLPAAFLLGTAVAKMIGGGHDPRRECDPICVITGLFGAIVWDLLNLVVGPADLLLPCFDWRLRRRGRHALRLAR